MRDRAVHIILEVGMTETEVKETRNFTRTQLLLVFCSCFGLALGGPVKKHRLVLGFYP